MESVFFRKLGDLRFAIVLAMARSGLIQTRKRCTVRYVLIPGESSLPTPSSLIRIVDETMAGSFRRPVIKNDSKALGFPTTQSKGHRHAKLFVWTILGSGPLVADRAHSHEISLAGAWELDRDLMGVVF